MTPAGLERISKAIKEIEKLDANFPEDVQPIGNLADAARLFNALSTYDQDQETIRQLTEALEGLIRHSTLTTNDMGTKYESAFHKAVAVLQPCKS